MIPSTAIRRLLTCDARSMAFAVIGAVIFGGLAYLSIEFTRGDDRIAAVWLPNAIATSVLLRARIVRKDLFLLALCLGNIYANLAVGDTLARAAILSLANVAEIVTAVSLMNRTCGPRADMRNIQHLGRFVLFGGLCAPAVSATIALAGLSFQAEGDIGTWLSWLATDGLGMIIIVPAGLIVADALADRSALRRGSRADWLLVTGAGTAVTVYVFSQVHYPFLFLIAPVVLSHAFRLGSLGTAFSMVMIAFIATWFTWNGSGPITLINGTLTEELMTLQLFLATSFFIGLPVAAILHRRDEMMAEVTESRAELHHLTQSITDAVLRFDNQGICLYASPSVQKVLGHPPSFYVGRLASQEAHPDAEDVIRKVERKLTNEEQDFLRFTYRRLKDDPFENPVYIEADCSGTYDPATGERTGFIVSSRDVSDRVRMEIELDRALRHAEQAARAKSEFLANMSHEIRTPMNGLLGFAELLLQGDLQGEQRQQAEMIHDSGKSMMLLLNDILDFSKIEARQISINREPFDLPALLQDCTRLHAAFAQRKGLDLTLRDGGILLRHVISDPHRVRQIVLNLVGNALKFTETGGVEVALALEAGDRLAITVSDTGIGISEERQEMIFTPFQQADGKTSRRFGGTGLGLSISRQLAELLGGTLTCRSKADEGSRFTLTIPLELADTASIPAQPVDSRSDTTTVLQPARILLAEDHDINRLLAISVLERCGQAVSVARDGNEAIAKTVEAYTLGQPFDLILMDIQMPGCDGYSATRKIRALGLTAQKLPIVALTANAFPEDIAAAREAGMQGHLAKPLVFSEMVEVLHRWLPAKIIEEDSIHQSLDAEEREHGVGPITDLPGPSPASSSSIHSRWIKRRAEAISAVERAIAMSRLQGDEGHELARIVHKLAGTAGVFGEAELGARATALERALKAEQPVDVAKALALELLKTASEGGHGQSHEAA